MVYTLYRRHSKHFVRPEVLFVALTRVDRSMSPVLSGWPSIADNSIMSNTPNYRGYRFPSEIIAQAVWLYHRFKLSFRDVEDLLAERGVTVSYETIRQWCRTFGPQYARRIKRRLGPRGDRCSSTRLSFQFRASVATYGEPSTRTVISSASSYKNVRIRKLLSASFESCFVLKRKFQ